ncbi:TVP38/TMEM64 family protein [Lichenibacterium dinghuense]|uniref:TVP38/TMEM64 family protein n=1 Tax=Lichenibacterium dinghuense TaxID=2895977 RepID=UPI001F31C12A|nr:VTT domain-containing protein [Lichenibacterium sp. 6Y81]
MIDPALAEFLTVTGLLTLGGLVLVPRAVVCVGAGAVLGWAAVLPSLLGTALGTTLGFLLARFVLAGVIRRFVARRPKVGSVLRAVESEGWRVLGLLRLASPVPGPAINFACGVSRMGYAEYILTTVIGVLPQTVLFVYLGRTGSEALASRSPWSLNGLTAAVGIALTIVALWRLKLAAARQSARMLADGEA